MKRECLRLIGNGTIHKTGNITKEDLLKEIDFVSERMASLSYMMKYVAGFNIEINDKADQLKRNSLSLEKFADYIDNN